MISATEALCLPSAQLSPEEKRAADVLEQAIENHVRAHMTRAGCEVPFEIDEIRSVVLAEVTQRVKRAGWNPQWQAKVQKGQFSNHQVLVGWRLAAIGPSDEAYKDATEIIASG